MPWLGTLSFVVSFLLSVGQFITIPSAVPERCVEDEGVRCLDHSTYGLLLLLLSGRSSSGSAVTWCCCY